MIDRYQLRYFLAVIDAGNFSRAAARMNVTQPTLSAGIAKLEGAVGAKLFFRNSQRVHLTAEGARFLVRARTIENEFNAAEGSIRSEPEVVRVRLGVLATIPTSLLDRVIQRHRLSANPDRVEILEGTERHLLSQLDRGRIDVALTLIRADTRRFAKEGLFREGYALAVPQTHRFARVVVVDGASLAEDVMIVRRHREMLSETSHYFTDRGVRPEFSFRTQNDDKVLVMVRAGLGITVMPLSYRSEGIARPCWRASTTSGRSACLFAD